MKDQKNSTSSEQQSDNRARKQPYEKPQLGTVTLFADQVMVKCRLSPPCLVLNPGMS
jgi:hypothetical protein